MDDAWIHDYTTTRNQQSTPKEKPQHKRRPSLLQQPAETRADVVVEPIAEANEEDPWRVGPPRATIARRAQSYSDFYHVVTQLSESKEELTRKRSIDGRNQHEAIAESELDFEDEFAALEDRLLDESHAQYESYAEQLLLSESQLSGLLTSTDDTLELLSSLSASFDAVAAQTEAFRQQCESMVTERRRLTGLADAIEDNARYYTYLEPMTRRLNAPGAANLVKGKDFPEMLSSLDSCLVYMEAHPKQLESATYRAKYRLLLTRGLTLIRHHFTRALGDIANDIAHRIQGGQLKETTHSALLYAKFRVPAPELKALGVEIQKRAVPTPDDVDAEREPEYAGLMRELYQSYSTTRGRLILPLVARKMAELAATSQQSDVLAFSKMAIGFMRGICLDEHELWFEWFESDGALYDFLESLMEPMYDYLRPRTIHETKLEKLCELCATIQARYMDIDADEDDEDKSDIDSGMMSPAANGRSSTPRKLDFTSLVQPALEDAQTRLVFLALGVLRDSIENYKPKPSDLEWPKTTATSPNGAKKGPALSGRRTSTLKSPTLDPETSPDPETTFPTSTNTTTTTQAWYPTLPSALHLLRRIYRLLHSSVFDDLAHRIVHSTTLSLIHASSLIASTKTPTSTSTSQLFLLSHLLHLKQQIIAFDLETATTRPPEVEFDFSSVTNTFYELRERGALWNPVGWYALVSGAVSGGLVPRVVENMFDAKAELDGRLRGVINEFVGGEAGGILAPVGVEAMGMGMKGGKGGDGFDAVKAVDTVRGLAERRAPLLRARLEAWFDGSRADDRRTLETLVLAVRDQVVVGYEEFFDGWVEAQGRSGEGGGQRRVSRKGKGREGDVLGPEVFGEVVGRVFEGGAAGSVFEEGEEDD